jgi:hypothetical protein
MTRREGRTWNKIGPDADGEPGGWYEHPNRLERLGSAPGVGVERIVMADAVRNDKVR